MTRIFDDPQDSPALAAFTEVTRAGVEPRTAAELDEGLDSLLARVSAGRTRRRRLVRWSLVGVTAGLCALVGIGLAAKYRQNGQAPVPPAWAYQIEGGSVLEGGYLRESGHDGIRLYFNEGSRFSLLPGTRGRLRAVDQEGARVAIEQGTASFQVRASRDRRWLVEVGPFLVTVKGTVFWVSWDPPSERFELELRRGRVVVSGPVSGGDIALRAGQRLVVSLPKAETLITEAKAEAATTEAAAASSPVTSPRLGPAAGRDKPAGPNPSVASASGPGAKAAVKEDSERRWADDLASGHWDRILEEVDRAGVDGALDKASSEDLFALADAARYRRRTDLARAALLAERRRFPGSPRALDTVFLLGRVEESRAGGTARALAWYDEYLTRAPAGPYAAEALGRKMTLTNEVGGAAEARTIAEEYLRRFPKGSYAGSARALRQVP